MLTSTLKTNNLTPHWLVCAVMLILLAVYNLICHLWAGEIRLDVPESDRILIRTTLYIIAIILFPLTNLIRHIFLRLNQTMPGEKNAEQRYLVTIIVTQSMIEAVSLFGPLMFLLGDDFNTLYIFTLLGVLGIYLHRPKQADLEDITTALSAQKRASE